MTNAHQTEGSGVTTGCADVVPSPDQSDLVFANK